MRVDVLFEDLPLSVQDLVDLIGFEQALKLVHRWGGRDGDYVPHHMPDDHHLVQLLGRDAADKLSRRYGGELLRLPKCVRAMIAARNREIRVRRARGETRPALAQRYDVTLRMIDYILGDSVSDTQQDLFARD